MVPPSYKLLYKPHQLVRYIYHLVMTNSLPWKITMLLIGKPSISMGHYTMAM